MVLGMWRQDNEGEGGGCEVVLGWRCSVTMVSVHKFYESLSMDLIRVHVS